MTTERNAFGVSLFAGNMLVSLPGIPPAVDPGSKPTAQGKCAAPVFAADADQRQDHVRARFGAHRRKHAYHIRGGNP